MDSVLEKAKQIRLLILDVDGVLTNGIIFYGSDHIEVKGFHIHDGLGIKLLLRNDIKVAVISAKKSDAVARRLKDLTIELVYLGHEDKLPIYNNLKKELGLSDHEIAYMGDDLPDLPILKRVGLSITVPKAPTVLLQNTDYITKKKSGKGAVREVCDMILEAQDKLQPVIQSYLNK